MNYIVLGKEAEFYVAYYLSKLGYEASVVNHQGYDIVAEVKNKTIKVEVKGSRSKIKDRNGFRFATKQGAYKNKRYLTQQMNSHIVAFCCMMDTPRIFFKPTHKITSISHSIYSIHFQNKDLEKETFDQSLKQISQVVYPQASSGT